MSTLHFNPDTSTLFLRPAEKAVGQRIDRSIVEALQESSFMGSPALQYIRNAIEEGRISLNQKKVCSPFELLEEVDSTISIVVPQEEQEAHELVLEVLEETDTFTAIWKPSGIPLDGPKKDALAPSVEAQFLSYGQEAFLRHAFRIKPLILNRLERWSEGIVIVFHSFAPYRRAQRHLETHPEHLRFRCLIRGGTPAAKNLLNLAQGILIENGTDICLSPEIVQSSSILRPDGTHFTVAEASENSLLLEVCTTSRNSHSLRKHLAKAGCAILGDRLFGKESVDGPLQLQCSEVSFPLGDALKSIRIPSSKLLHSQ